MQYIFKKYHRLSSDIDIPQMGDFLSSVFEKQALEILHAT